MRGYEVVTSDRHIVGHVADVRDGYLIVEFGGLRRSRRPVPREFVHVVDEAAQVFVTVPRRVLREAPKVRRGDFDPQEAARHFGLASSYEETPNWDAILAGKEPPEHRRAETRKHLRPGTPSNHDRRSPALFGDRHWDARRVKED